jgi:hypothetical protein
VKLFSHLEVASEIVEQKNGEVLDLCSHLSDPYIPYTNVRCASSLLMVHMYFPSIG